MSRFWIRGARCTRMSCVLSLRLHRNSMSAVSAGSCAKSSICLAVRLRSGGGAASGFFSSLCGGAACEICGLPCGGARCGAALWICVALSGDARRGAAPWIGAVESIDSILACDGCTYVVRVDRLPLGVRRVHVRRARRSSVAQVAAPAVVARVRARVELLLGVARAVVGSAVGAVIVVAVAVVVGAVAPNVVPLDVLRVLAVGSPSVAIAVASASSIVEAAGITALCWPVVAMVVLVLVTRRLSVLRGRRPRGVADTTAR